MKACREEWLTAGFEKAKPLDTKYDPYEMQDAWMAKNGNFPGYNCRITAMELFGDFVSAGDEAPNRSRAKMCCSWTRKH